MRDDTVSVGLLGCGNVGAALAEQIHEQADAIAARTGVQLAIGRIGVRDLTVDRGLAIPPEVFTDDPMAVVTDPDIDLVVEVIGGIEPARELILAALKSGKPVVTANKELLANHGAELIEAAEQAGVDLLFEASVAGGIPIIRPLRESLAGEPITRIMGIVNGTTNYILTRMTDAGSDFADALAEAQALGYAEADPTADVEAFDAAAKAAILATIAFGARVGAADVHREGITAISAADIASAARLGYVIKLLAIAESTGDDVAVRVHPALVPQHHPLASVRDAFNAVFIEGDRIGQLMFLGRGAGGDPTASAVLGDLIDAAKNLAAGRRGATLGTFSDIPVRPIDDVASGFSIILDATDEPGVLAIIATAFGNHNVSIRSMQQTGHDSEAEIVLITHPAREADVRSTIDDLRALDVVTRVSSIVRVIDAG